ncbi:MAG: hypothetical protein PARBA_02402 [Parabacteroides sp.]
MPKVTQVIMKKRSLLTFVELIKYSEKGLVGTNVKDAVKGGKYPCPIWEQMGLIVLKWDLFEEEANRISNDFRQVRRLCTCRSSSL